MSNEQAIWEAFCDQLKAAGKVIMRDDLPTSEFDRGEYESSIGPSRRFQRQA